MKYFQILLILAVTACNNKSEPAAEAEKDTVVVHDTVLVESTSTTNVTVNQTPAKEKPVETPKPKEKVTPKPADPHTPYRPKVYANKRFKDVTVEKIGAHKFRIKGKGQIFEASFSWVIEDGHEELKKGFEMTDAGAPEWGNFNFTVDAAKKRPNSTLHIILFESSAKDGSRQYELSIPLY